LDCRISGFEAVVNEVGNGMNEAQIQEVDPEVAQIYEDSRVGGRYQILYIDDQVVLLRAEEEGRRGKGVHRVEERGHFVKSIESGRFKYRPDSNLDMMGLEDEDWTDLDHIGEKTNENLHEAGINTTLDVQQAEEGELLDVNGLGKMGLASIDAYCH
jgi:hypothetical protein